MLRSLRVAFPERHEYFASVLSHPLRASLGSYGGFLGSAPGVVGFRPGFQRECHLPGKYYYITSWVDWQPPYR